jgi:hypothetical protein
MAASCMLRRVGHSPDLRDASRGDTGETTANGATAARREKHAHAGRELFES